MGEKAQEQGSLRRLPSAAVTAVAGVVAGLVVAAPVAVAVVGEDGTETVAAVVTTTTEAPTTTAPTTTATTAPAPPVTLAAVLTVTATEQAGDITESSPVGTTIDGTTLACTADACQVQLVIGRLAATVDVPMVGGSGSAGYRYAIVPEGSECVGVGTLEGSGTVELRRDADRILGTVTRASDVFDVVRVADDHTCHGGRTTYDLVATPA